VWLDHNEGILLGHIVSSEARAQQKAQQDAGGIKTYLFQLFTGFPIEVYNPVRKRPVFLLSLIGLLVLLFIFQLGAGAWFTQLFALIPNQLWNGRQTWGILTYAFLHASPVHLLGNLYFLYIFGDNIEDTLGKGKLALIFLLTSLAGGFFESGVSPQSAVSIIGASGAISGIMGSYFVLFPKVKVWVVFFFIRFKLAALWYLGIWVLTQILYMLLGRQGVAWFAHLGGFIAGVLVTLLLRAVSPSVFDEP
jgi:membrane associated rhomboid family serine protease